MKSEEERREGGGGDPGPTSLPLPLAKSAQQLGKVGAGCWERALQADCAHIEVDCGQLVLPAGL